jgi:hypothetical protein
MRAEKTHSLNEKGLQFKLLLLTKTINTSVRCLIVINHSFSVSTSAVAEQ